MPRGGTCSPNARARFLHRVACVAPEAKQLRFLLEDVVYAEQGVGQLLQRDYFAVIDGCRVSPTEVMEMVSRKFCDFSPAPSVRFARRNATHATLEVGDDLDVAIASAGNFRVRVVCKDPQTLTLATLTGHPEAGRITFGAYRNDDRDVVFHIRSRARSSKFWFALGYAALGEALQTSAWADFVWSVACTFGKGVLGVIHAHTEPVSSEAGAPEGPEDVCTPTFRAQGN